jgi:hypothetical protein
LGKSLLIDSSRHQAALHINTQMVLQYWQIGRRIQTEILKNKRGAYGKKAIESLSIRLIRYHEKGYKRAFFGWYDLPRFILKNKLCARCAHNSAGHIYEN